MGGDDTYDTVPVYADTSNEDYRLSDKSPLVGKGSSEWDDYNIDAPTVDLLGLSRPSPSGSEPDMGAYENSLAASSSPLPVADLVATSATNGAKLSWTKNKSSLGSTTDASNVEYQIYKDGTLAATTANIAYTLTGLTNGTSYSLAIAALDTTTKLEGAKSDPIAVVPRYLGPWYVAAGSGATAGDTLTDYNVGSSTTPLSNLEVAITLATKMKSAGDTIILQEGTHEGASDRDQDWNNTRSLVIMGDPSLTADKIIINAKGNPASNTSGITRTHFTFDSGEDTTTQIIGLTLQNGYTKERGGGSVYIYNSSVKFKGVIFKNNYTTGDDWSSSGAIFVYNSATVIDSCIFEGNYISLTTNQGAN